MKKVSMKIALAALLIAVGTLGVQAQVCRGTGFGPKGTGTCINSTQLTAEQKAILAELATEHQADMTVLREKLIATTDLTEKIAIRKEMADLRTAHQAEVKKLLESWGITTGCRRK
jgi:Skp family chaperone for outer membrane proteins